MTVNPGWGGQAFIPASLGKIERLRALLGAGHRRSRSTAAIDASTAGACAAGRGHVFVAGSAVFGRRRPGRRVPRDRAPRPAGAEPAVGTARRMSAAFTMATRWRREHRPHRRRPPVLSRERPRAARVGGVRRHRRGGGRRVRRSPRPSGCAPSSCCSTSSCRTSTASRCAGQLTNGNGPAHRARLEPRLVGLRPARGPLRAPAASSPRPSSRALASTSSC